MGKTATKIAKRVKATATDLENRALAAEGRRAIRGRVATAKKVTKKAIRSGAIAGVVVAAAVIVREAKKRKKLNG
jgi:hypothetical protein